MNQTAYDNNGLLNKEFESMWRIEMFGSLRLLPPGASVAGAITHLAMRKSGALLAYLAYHCSNRYDDSHGRDALAEVLWPDSNTEKGRNNLRVSLNRLRNTIQAQGYDPDTLITVEKNRIGLVRQKIVTDVQCFEQCLQAADGSTTIASRTRYLCDAVDLYRGELLRDYEESWISTEARRLEGLFFDGVRDLLLLLEEQNEIERAIRYAYQAVHINPLREEAHHDLLRLYAAGGQYDEARLHYERFSKTLRKNFGRSPGPATRALMAPLLKPQVRAKSINRVFQHYSVVELAAKQSSSNFRTQRLSWMSCA